MTLSIICITSFLVCGALTWLWLRWLGIRAYAAKIRERHAHLYFWHSIIRQEYENAARARQLGDWPELHAAEERTKLAIRRYEQEERMTRL
jgi:hypothetical protein